MIDMTDVRKVGALKTSFHIAFDSPQGKEVLEYLESICHWYPSILDKQDTNSIIARDAQRRVIGTIKTFLKLSPEQIVALAQKGGK